MAKTVIWNRDEQEFVRSGERTLVFASSGDANTFLGRGALKRQDEKTPHPRSGQATATTTYDLVTVQ